MITKSIPPGAIPSIPPGAITLGQFLEHFNKEVISNPEWNKCVLYFKSGKLIHSCDLALLPKDIFHKEVDGDRSIVLFVNYNIERIESGLSNSLN
jgi:hypothetical protein